MSSIIIIILLLLNIGFLLGILSTAIALQEDNKAQNDYLIDIMNNILITLKERL